MKRKQPTPKLFRPSVAAKVQRDREKIVAELKRIAGVVFRYMPNRGYGPTPSHWDKFRAFGLPQSVTIMRYLDLEWAGVLALADLHEPTMSTTQNLARQLGEESEIRRMDEATPWQGVRPKRLDHGDAALHCIERKITVRVWCPVTHRYVPYGEQVVYEVR